MSEGKKRDISIKRLIEIAQALNQNSIANRSRKKEEKIATDKFIRQFGINRKDFSVTIKGTGIEYNKSTFLYDIPSSEDVNKSTTNQVYKLDTKVNQKKSSEEVNSLEVLKNKEVNHINTESRPQSIPKEVNELLSLTAELKEMLEWYRKQTNPNVIETEIYNINLNDPKLDGEVVTRSFKIYKDIAEEFKDFATTRKETIKDLVSIALLEFIEKYKN